MFVHVCVLVEPAKKMAFTGLLGLLPDRNGSGAAPWLM